VKKLSGGHGFERVKRKNSSESKSSKNYTRSGSPRHDDREGSPYNKSANKSLQSKQDQKSEYSQSRDESVGKNSSSYDTPRINPEPLRTTIAPETIEITAAPTGSGLFSTKHKPRRQIEIKRETSNLARRIQVVQPESRPLLKKNSLSTFEVYEYAETIKRPERKIEAKSSGESLLSRIQKKAVVIEKSGSVDIRSRIIKKPRQF
jgi:hypothetical protein